MVLEWSVGSKEMIGANSFTKCLLTTTMAFPMCYGYKCNKNAKCVSNGGKEVEFIKYLA